MIKKFATKKEISEIFGVPIDTLNKDLAQMKCTATFKNDIIKPSYRRLLVSIEGYENFLRDKEMRRNNFL
ncbi:MAG: hypothetical protein FWG33_01995 [Oscillospiraceae bacterium]|nr:hypothetical protein [Oscillospiraceae bacterium]